MDLPVTFKHHPIDQLLALLDQATGDKPIPGPLLDALAELKHSREHIPRCVNLASRERDRRMGAERERDQALAESALVRRAWVAAALPGAPPGPPFNIPDATG